MVVKFYGIPTWYNILNSSVIKLEIKNKIRHFKLNDKIESG